MLFLQHSVHTFDDSRKNLLVRSSKFLFISVSSDNCFQLFTFSSVFKLVTCNFFQDCFIGICELGIPKLSTDLFKRLFVKVFRSVNHVLNETVKDLFLTHIHNAIKHSFQD